MFHPYSHSKLSSFESCPMMFKFRYIDKLEPETRPDYFERGSKIHAELERYPAAQSQELQEFFASDVGKKCDAILRNPTKRELRIGFDSDFELTSYKPSNILNGVIDLIYIKDEIVHLVDWKTGKVPHEQDWSQLETYAAAFLKDHLVEISYVYIDAKKENTKLYQPQQRQGIIDRIKSKIQQVESCQNFDRCITWKCEYCQFKSICKPQDFGLENVTINISKKDF